MRRAWGLRSLHLPDISRRSSHHARQTPCRVRLLQTGQDKTLATHLNKAERVESHIIRTVDKLFDHVASEAGQDMSRPSRSSPSVMRDLSAAPWLASLQPAEREAGSTTLATPSARKMSDSYTCFDLSFSKNERLLERYLNTSGGLRIGLLLEHIDSLAGAIAYRHCLPALHSGSSAAPSSEANALDSSGSLIGAAALLSASHEAGLYIATASVDRLDLFQKMGREELQDLRFSGFCTYVGRSSMEVIVKMSGLGRNGNGIPRTLLLGRFSMVCRDASSHQARRVPALELQTDEERALFSLGEERKTKKRQSSAAALDRVPPTTDEVGNLHALMLQTQAANGGDAMRPDGQAVVSMAKTQLNSVTLIQPQDRNLHGMAFGGLLIRLAFELAFVTSATFAGEPLRFLSLDEISFKLPVPIGAVLHLEAKVVKTTKPDEAVSQTDGSQNAKAHIMVTAQVEDVASGVRRTTNDFFFSFALDRGRPFAKMIVPQTYQEAMLFLEGARRLEVAGALRRLIEA